MITAALLGVLEGITEFLPISSTAHLILASFLLGIPQDAAHRTFEVVIQLGAILAVAVSAVPILRRSPRLIILSIAGFLPTGVLGYLFSDGVDMLFNPTGVILAALFLGGIVLLFVRERSPHRQISLSLWIALLLGTAQALAMIPGVSRSAATIVAGLLLGLSRKDAVEFSFLLAIPTLVTASGYDLLKHSSALSADQWTGIGVGFITAFMTALLVVRWFLAYVQHRSFAVFGWYRIVLAIVFAGLMMY